MEKELANNFRAFSKQWPVDMLRVFDALGSEEKQFEASYTRLCCVQALREMLVDEDSVGSALSFLTEAQNDLLMSHCLARVGSFRSSLKSLRASVENFYFFAYYKDHPVELSRWFSGDHRISFSDLHNYFEAHPEFKDVSIAMEALVAVKKEYAVLSKAVHGSNVAFQMTAQSETINLWDASSPSVGKWITRERAVVVSMISLLATLYRSKLQGASHLGVRHVMMLALPSVARTKVKAQLSINFPVSA